MKIAVNVDNEGNVAPHLGKAESFFIYKYENGVADFIEERAGKGSYTDHVIDEILDCDAVISARIGEGMIQNLDNLGVRAIIEPEILDPVEAIENIEFWEV